VHLHKLDAFLDRYCAGLDNLAAQAVQAQWRAWSRGEGVAEAWPTFRAQWGALQPHAARWAEDLFKAGDLASRLVQFSTNRL
jgi:hypothetical protein